MLVTGHISQGRHIDDQVFRQWACIGDFVLDAGVAKRLQFAVRAVVITGN